MGQKTEFNLEDWDFPEEKSTSKDTTLDFSDTDFISDIDEDFSLLEQSLEPLADQEPSAQQEPSANQEPLAPKQPSNEQKNAAKEEKIVVNKPLAETKSLIEVHGNKIHISGKNDNLKELTQEEEAFRRQIEDLFELLELEKTADKNDGIRVYQTDSSPSKPWRFH